MTKHGIEIEYRLTSHDAAMASPICSAMVRRPCSRPKTRPPRAGRRHPNGSLPRPGCRWRRCQVAHLPVTAADFAAWVSLMRETRGWSAARCSRELGCGLNQVRIWQHVTTRSHTSGLRAPRSPSACRRGEARASNIQRRSENHRLDADRLVLAAVPRLQPHRHRQRHRAVDPEPRLVLVDLAIAGRIHGRHRVGHVPVQHRIAADAPVCARSPPARARRSPAPCPYSPGPTERAAGRRPAFLAALVFPGRQADAVELPIRSSMRQRS